jgi:hypothetical protein
MQIPQLFGEPGNNRQNVWVHVKNVDSTPILRGAPCVYAMNGSNDGHAVINSVTAGANKSQAYFAGVATKDIPVGEVGMSLISGVTDFVRCSGAVVAEQGLAVNVAASNFAPGALISAISAVVTVGPAVMPLVTAAAASTTVEGVANVCPRAMVKGL